MTKTKYLFLLIITLFITLNAYGKDNAFAHYEVKEFTFKGHAAKIVYPNKSESHNYWIWRARFWAHQPQLDKALLEKGFFVVYVDVANLFGNSEAVDLWDQFYKYCVEEEGLNEKAVLEGMSRGGLIVYNWASKNTDKVFSIYADAPVCDIKSWPGGLYKGEGSAKEWKTCLEVYALDSVSVMAYDDLPLNNCVCVAEANIPVIHVYGEEDKIVPYAENTAIVVEKMRAAGGIIKLIPKPGVGHHPHCLKDPQVILDFILDSVE